MSRVPVSASRGAGDAAAIPPDALDQAAEWLMRLHDDDVTDADRLACERWRASRPENAQAWSRAEHLLGMLGGLPAPLALPTLGRDKRAERRHTLVKLAALLAAGPAAWALWHHTQDGGWRADFRTATGEQRRLRLADGGEITLNTATAIDVRYDDELRLIILHHGEIHIATAADSTAPARPFEVHSPHGQLRALGTRFRVRLYADHGELSVRQGAVRIAPTIDGKTATVIQAGQQARFQHHRGTSPAPADAGADAWTQGMLMADDMRLADLIAELARYRAGLLRCDPAVADLRISGAFPVTDVDAALRMLAATHPLRVHTRTRYWTTVGAASPDT